MSDTPPEIAALLDDLAGQERLCGCHRVLADNCPRRRLRPAQGFGLSLESRTDVRHTARLIDHTLLRPDASRAEIDTLCDQGRTYGFGAVCVNPCWVAVCAQRLLDTPTAVATVAGFPLGASHPETKSEEARRAVNHGASEVDMVINVGALRSRDYRGVLADIAGVVIASGRAMVKVILETALLTDEEKTAACLLAKLGGADFVKTSTGFGPAGATVADVALLRRLVGPALGVKASGGIRDWPSTLTLLEAGADRIGTSAGVAILNGRFGRTV